MLKTILEINIILFKVCFQLLLQPIILIPLIIYFIIWFIKYINYKKETYFKQTNMGYFKTRYNTGRFGEYLTYKYLKKFESQGAKFLFNIYVPKKDEETTEIDVLMISTKGLFVFESKNYSGWVFGNDNQKYWYQTLPTGRRRSHKEKFYNPVFQNNTHVKYLKSILGDVCPIHSIITFSDRCVLKSIDIHSSQVHIINRCQVYSLVTSIYRNYENFLSEEQINDIYNKLYPYTQVDEIVKQKHIEDINARTTNFTTNNEKIIQEGNEIIEHSPSIDIDNSEANITEQIKGNNSDNLICPICGAPLLLRTAKHGEHKGKNFYGCSNYPKCKYIKNKE